jgi:hypothetical protein
MSITFDGKTIFVPFTNASTLAAKSKVFCDFIVANKDDIEYGFTMLAFKNDETATALLHDHIELGLERKPNHYNLILDAYFPEELETVEVVKKAPVKKTAVKKVVKTDEVVKSPIKRKPAAKKAIDLAEEAEEVVKSPAKRGRPAAKKIDETPKRKPAVRKPAVKRGKEEDDEAEFDEEI